MDAFVLDFVSASGIRRGGRTYWTEQSAIREAERQVRFGKASRIRVLKLTVNPDPIAERGKSDCEVSGD